MSLGYYLTFNGSTQKGALSSAASYNGQNGTIECRFKTTSNDINLQGLMVKQQGYGMYIYYNTLFVYDWTLASGFFGGGVVNDGQWHHAAFSFQSGTTNGSKLYLDGILVNTFTYTFFLTQGNGNPLYIGASYSVTTPASPIHHFNGSMDEVRIWSSVLSAATILSNYTSINVSPTSSGLTGYWKLNEGSGTVANNSVSGQPDFTLIGSPTWTPAPDYAVNAVNNNERGINDYLVSETSTDTTNSGYKINGQDIYKKYKKRATLGYGLNYKNFGYKLNGTDISTLFDFKLFSASSALNVVTNVANGVLIQVTGSGTLTFNFGLKKLGFVVVGGGGCGTGSYNRSAGAGGGAGELDYGTYDCGTTTKYINSFDITIGNGGSTDYTNGNGETSILKSNNSYLNINANGGGKAGYGYGVTSPGKVGGSGGGGSGRNNGVAANGGLSVLSGDTNYTMFGNRGGAGGAVGGNNDQYAGGGGGGAGGVGGDGNAFFNGGNGGAGYDVSFGSVSIGYLAGGGGGGAGGGDDSNNGVRGIGGIGGGGGGGDVDYPAEPGSPNTGGGGGGISYNGGTNHISGGSGVVYLYIENSYIVQ